MTEEKFWAEIRRACAAFNVQDLTVKSYVDSGFAECDGDLYLRVEFTYCDGSSGSQHFRDERVRERWVSDPIGLARWIVRAIAENAFHHVKLAVAYRPLSPFFRAEETVTCTPTFGSTCGDLDGRVDVILAYMLGRLRVYHLCTSASAGRRQYDFRAGGNPYVIVVDQDMFDRVLQPLPRRLNAPLDLAKHVAYQVFTPYRDDVLAEMFRQRIPRRPPGNYRLVTVPVCKRSRNKKAAPEQRSNPIVKARRIVHD